MWWNARRISAAPWLLVKDRERSYWEGREQRKIGENGDAWAGGVMHRFKQSCPLGCWSERKEANNAAEARFKFPKKTLNQFLLWTQAMNLMPSLIIWDYDKLQGHLHSSLLFNHSLLWGFASPTLLRGSSKSPVVSLLSECPGCWWNKTQAKLWLHDFNTWKTDILRKFSLLVIMSFKNKCLFFCYSVISLENCQSFHYLWKLCPARSL